MNGIEAKRTILIAIVFSAGLASVTDLAAGKLPPLRIGIGALVAGVLLTGAAEVAPEVAGAVGLLALTTSVFVYGGPAFAALAKVTSTDPKPFTDTAGGGDFPTNPKGAAK